MSNIDPRILAKIKKCLALGASPNPNEAATAMRQAAALMRQHGVSAQHVAMAEVGECEAKIRTMARDKPAHWEAALASVVGKAFGCQLLIQRSLYPKVYRQHANEGQFVFVGQKAQAEIAAYTVAVLSRKCKATRQKWIAQELRGLSEARGGRAKTTRLGDAFAEGWVAGIERLVADFANPEPVDAAIGEYVKQKAAGKSAPTREPKRCEAGFYAAAIQGLKAASGESIYRPMEAHGPKQAIEHDDDAE